MHIKRFEAADAAEAMRQVRAELGSNAIVLHTKPVRREGLRGLLFQTGVEVLAAVDRDHAATAVGGSASALSSQKFSIPYPEPRIPVPDSRFPVPNRRFPTPDPRFSIPKPQTPNPDLSAELGEIKALLGRLLTLRRFDGLQTLPAPLVDLYDQLIAHEVLDPLAYEIVSRFQDDLGGRTPSSDELQAELGRRLSQMVKISGPVEANGPGRVIAFVGPTGVGKTTTIAKLAAHHRVVEKRRVAILTADTYRIGAVEQLKTYAEILDVPCEVAVTPADITVALSRHATADLIFLDTTGRSPKNEMGVSELRPFLGAARPAEIHLLLGATGKSADLLETAQRFRALGATRLAFTKLDETTSYGPLFNVSYHADLPISYFTTGQEVPDDIEEASADRLAALVLHGGR